MMKFFKIFAAAMIAVLFVSSLCACGNKIAQSNTDAQETEVSYLPSDKESGDTLTETANKENSQITESYVADEDELEILTNPQSDEKNSETEDYEYVTENELESGPVFDMGDSEDPLGDANSIELPFVPAP